MASHSNDRAAIPQERRVLQALCKGDSKALKTAGRLLTEYRWREPIHQIIFSCLKGLNAGGPLTLRQRVVECATRKGFPDVDWEEFFSPQPISSQEAEVLICRLHDSDPGEI